MATVDRGEWRCVECGRAYTDRTAGAVCPHDDRVLVPAATAERFGGDALLGRHLADNYLIFDILGLGGFGAVYRAVDQAHDGRHVAIKTIRPGAERHNADARARFAQEARLLGRLRNEHIVEVYRYGETNDALFMAIELVPGRSLKRILRSRGRLSPRRSVNIAAQILDALDHAHAEGMVHRDLKPANTLVVENQDDAVKVIDFGIAKVLEAEDEEEGPKTGTGLVLGTVRYMAPEQLRQGGEVGPATDLYALGVMFYEMLAGRPPFDGSQAEIAAAHLYQPAPDLDPDLAPATLRAWVARALAKQAEDRYPDALSMRVALLEALPGAVPERADRSNSGVLPGIEAPVSGSMDGLSGPSSHLGASALAAGRLGSGPVPESGSAPAPTSHDPVDDGDALADQTALSDQVARADVTTRSDRFETPGAIGASGSIEAPADPTASASPGSTLPDGDVMGPTVESPRVDAELAALPDLDPNRGAGGGSWGDIDVASAPTVLRESSGTIQAARGELGVSDEPEPNRKWWWLVPLVAAAAVALLLLGPWGGDVTEDEPETIRLSVGQTPDEVVPTPRVAVPVDAAARDAAAPDAAIPDAAAPDAAAPPKRKTMGWRQVERLEGAVTKALGGCRCSHANALIKRLPREFPRDRKRKLSRRAKACQVPLVDQVCVDGEVR